MMAAEATQENLADAANLADKQNVLTEPRQDVPPISPPPINGEASSIDGDQGLSGRAIQPTSAAASISGGSDTEISKGENSKLHVRTASIVKKPTSFKAVTVNKTFLASKGATATASSKLGENKSVAGSAAVQAGPLVSATPRPRLVAKTGSGVRDSAPRSSAAANGVKPGTAPDPSAVWNKNRPAPPPEVKRLTDEDLRKQYGIHLATRIQGDDQGKQANWADIDDDEEDWAPETIEWTDGTKITLHQADEPMPIPVEQHQPKPIAALAPPEIPKPQSPALPSSSTSTIKLGGISGGPGKGLVLKGAAEKPTLVAKPPGPPTPVKSPWASLPPVDKVAPIVIEPQSLQPQQQAPPRFNQRDVHGFESMPPQPTKEIAADDFSRGWRDNAQNRELFNSQSGRYEPVTDNRRNSRNDVHSRQPALLQRPSSHDQQGPAEPSGAFQTHRISGENSYGRRRNSSNVSGGSSNNLRRMSFSRGGEMPTSHEIQDPRRGSLAAVSDSPSSPRNYSPVAPVQRTNPGQPWSRASPATSHNSPSLMHSQMAPPHQSGKSLTPVEDEVELQKKVMAESREAARKRRSEMAAKEEAEKQERIRLKLESMGPPPESNKQRKYALSEEKATPTQIQIRDLSDVQSKEVLPEVTGELNQTGAHKAESSQDPVSNALLDANHEGSKPSLPASLTSRTSAQEEKTNASDLIPSPHQVNSSSQSWQNTPQSSRYSSWNANAHSNTSRNVWGGHLGNGSFGLQETAGAQNAPGAIGPLNSYRPNNLQSGRGREPFNNRPDPIGPPNNQSIAPRSGLHQATQNQTPSPWSNFSIAEADRQLATDKAAQHAARIEQEAVEGVKEAERIDTWKRVDVHDNGNRSRIKLTATTIKPATINGIPLDEATPPARLLGANGVRHDAITGLPNNNASIMTTSPAQRGSRFFPNRDVRLEDQSLSFGRPSSPSPPPPTMAGHPVYDGDSLRPHVSLPRPPPVVKLPPAKLAPIGPPKPTASFAAVASSSSQSLSNNATTQSTRQQLRGQYPPSTPGEQNWQNKINDLIGRKASPPKSYAFAVDSSSKHAFELTEAQASATVTLPGSRSGISDDDSSFTTKPMAEECFEEQEMGSRPVFNFPRASTAPWVSSPRPKPNPQKPKAPDIISSKALQFYPETSSGAPTIGVLIPGMEIKKIVSAVFLRDNRQKSNPRRGGQRGGSSRGSSSYSRGGRREASSNYPPSKLDNASSPSPNSHSTSSRGRGRGFGTNWSASRHVSTPVTSN